MKKSAQNLGVVAAFAALLSVSSAHATDYFPASECNYDPGIQPNSGGGLGNWTGSTKRIFCGFDWSSGDSFNGGAIKLSSSSASCFLKVAWGNGNGSTYSSTGYDTWGGGFNFLFSQSFSFNHHNAYAFECNLQDGVRAVMYNVD